MLHADCQIMHTLKQQASIPTFTPSKEEGSIAQQLANRFSMPFCFFRCSRVAH
jgi:hypothetical protein